MRLENTILIFTSTSTELEGLLGSARQVPGLEFVGAVYKPRDLEPAVRSFRPDVLLIHLSGFSTDWVELTAALHRLGVIKGIIVMTDVLENSQVIALLTAGVNAIIPRNAGPEDLTTAIREAVSNRLYIPPRHRNSH